MNLPRLALAGLALLTWAAPAAAHDPEAKYLANEGVMVTRGETKILFDPLFGESFGQYELVPEDMRAAMLAGEAPFDGVDAVFVSHAHADHFAAEDMVAYMRAVSEARLYAPQQAVDMMAEIAGADDPIFARVTPIALERLDDPARLNAAGIAIEAVRVPHAGWPQRADVENLIFRVTLDDETTVMHMGDADVSDWHYAPHQEVWDERALDAAFPPYWFLTSEAGRSILTNRFKPARTIGVHVPSSVPDDPAAREKSLRDADLFTRPGETRRLDE
ncbi:MAG: MBL fold metallo-hydrolase [Euryhalocaulis sp.]|uniref:MBL fold metallo-hydrolase n=1 Tax=Euryhalocaulis sp. TaxID=2744307 RepID=UPI00184D54C6|nr:MBL fold metallo-hydrolase [Euryhalocaulis sp.]MBA4801125.1 MBL fold metallo-hydrolase [Euryhalocaulis sp.]